MHLRFKHLCKNLSLSFSDRWARQTAQPWPRGSAAGSLKFPPAWTSFPFSTSFTKLFGKWGERQIGVSVRSSSANTSPRSACPLLLPSPPAIKSCPLQPPQSWLRWSPPELKANAEPPRLHCSRALRSSDVMLPSSDTGEDLFWYWRRTTSLTYLRMQ